MKTALLLLIDGSDPSRSSILTKNRLFQNLPTSSSLSDKAFAQFLHLLLDPILENTTPMFTEICWPTIDPFIYLPATHTNLHNCLFKWYID
jgi:hypothetical protein